MDRLESESVHAAHGEDAFRQGTWNVMSRDFERDFVPMYRMEGSFFPVKLCPKVTAISFRHSGLVLAS